MATVFPKCFLRDTTDDIHIHTLDTHYLGWVVLITLTIGFITIGFTFTIQSHACY
jgi:hypothetical protein